MQIDLAFFNTEDHGVKIPGKTFLFKALDGQFRPVFQVKDQLAELVREQALELKQESKALPFGHSPYDEKAAARWDKNKDEG